MHSSKTLSDWFLMKALLSPANFIGIKPVSLKHENRPPIFELCSTNLILSALEIFCKKNSCYPIL